MRASAVSLVVRLAGNVALVVPLIFASSDWGQAAAETKTARYADNVPAVLLSAEHAALCKVNVGDAFPAIELPKIGGEATKLESLAGKQATVVVFWAPDHWMSRVALKDAAALGARSKAGDVAVVGIAEGAEDAVQKEIKRGGGELPQLLDADGQGLANVGSTALPRVYVLDAARKIAWFDIEYSESTRRELAATLGALSAKK